MTKSTVFAAALSIVLCAACTDRLTAPEAVELVNSVEQSQRLGGVWMSDRRLTAALTTSLRRNGQERPYRAIVFERVVLPGQPHSMCAGTRRSAYLWRDDGDRVAFYPEGMFDVRFVPAMGTTCQQDSLARSTPLVTIDPPNIGTWIQQSGEGEIAPGRVTGSCRFLEPEAARFLREEFGIGCELTSHRVRFRAVLLPHWPTEADSLKLEHDESDIIGVRYTINCELANNRVSGPCAAPATR